jgi:hypothetical protein
MSYQKSLAPDGHSRLLLAGMETVVVDGCHTIWACKEVPAQDLERLLLKLFFLQIIGKWSE